MVGIGAACETWMWNCIATAEERVGGVDNGNGDGARRMASCLNTIDNVN